MCGRNLSNTQELSTGMNGVVQALLPRKMPLVLSSLLGDRRVRLHTSQKSRSVPGDLLEVTITR